MLLVMYIMGVVCCHCITIYMFVLLGKTLPHDSTPLKVAGVTDGSRIMILGKKVNQIIYTLLVIILKYSTVQTMMQLSWQ